MLTEFARESPPTGESRPDQIPRVIGVVQTATRLKLGLLVLSIVQVIGLALGVAARKLSH